MVETETINLYRQRTINKLKRKMNDEKGNNFEGNY